MGVKECPHRMYPAAWMASRRLFFIEYGNIDDADIEMIRIELARTFKYGNTLSLPQRFPRMLLFVIR